MIIIKEIWCRGASVRRASENNRGSKKNLARAKVQKKFSFIKAYANKTGRGPTKGISLTTAKNKTCYMYNSPFVISSFLTQKKETHLWVLIIPYIEIHPLWSVKTTIFKEVIKQSWIPPICERAFLSPVCDLSWEEGSEKNSQEENSGCEWLLPLPTAHQVKLEYLCIHRWNKRNCSMSTCKTWQILE